MDLARMLDKCRSGQWDPDDLNWSVAPRPLSRAREIAIVQYFTDMAGIERLAKALFAEQGRRTDDPTLAAIFATFVVDEERHAVVAERLARHYDRNHYRDYRLSETLVKFRGPFLDAIRFMSAEIANAYITTGELLLDIALLRSLADYVDDDMCRQAMRLINRDESRHIAIDYYMTEYYASARYQAWVRQQPRPSVVHRARAWRAFVLMLWYAAPFIRDVFVAPMQITDPEGRRMREAFKRAQMIGNKPEVAARPFSRFVIALQRAYDTPLLRRTLGPLLTRASGVPGDVLTDMLSEEDRARVATMSYDELADEALSVKSVA